MRRVEKFRDWIKTSRPGQIYIYYTGFLAIQRGHIIDIGGREQYMIANGDVDALGNLAASAFEDNRVHLFQRKLRDNEYEYIAMKRYAGGATW